MKKTTMMKNITYLASIGLALFLSQRVSAQDDHWAWNATNQYGAVLPNTTNTTWSDPNNWSEGIVPPSGTNVPAGFSGNVWLDPANGDNVITIEAGDFESPDWNTDFASSFNPPYNTIFGPEFGATLNIYGALTFDWTIAPYAPNPAQRSHINMFDGSYMYTTGASLNLGDGWWTIADGCYVTMNMYGNSRYSSLGGAGWWWGGHLNVYDTATFLINGYVNMGDVSNPNWAQSDGTRSLVIGGGTVILPESTLASVYDWIGRGLVRAYGKGEDTNDLDISDQSTNIVVTPAPLGGALQRVYFQPVLRVAVPVGTFQQVVLAGDYPAVTGVYLSSAEPGLDPATFPQPVYTSSNPNVITVDSNGVATAINPGSATLSAKVGAFTSTNTVSITVANTTSLMHRYSFSETSGTTTADSIGGTNYAGTLQGGATLGGGQVTLDGATGYVQLPAGMLSNLDEVTIETWASFGSPINNYACLFCFGYSDQTGDANNGYGADYINVQMDYAGSGNTHLTFGQGIPGFDGESTAVTTNLLNGISNVQIVAVYHPYAGYESLYTNGALAATQPIFNTMSDPVAFAGPTYNSGSILAYTLGPQSVFDGALVPDQNNFIGWDVYQGSTFGTPAAGGTGDPTLNGSVDEFRIYNGPLTAAQIAADYALGPNQLVGTSTSVSLAVTLKAGNVVITWPTTSALVNLTSSPVLGKGAVWTSVGGAPVVVGGNYQVTVPVSGTAQYFRLQLY